MTESNHQHQVDIFAPDIKQRHFAELCNALYERELNSLSQRAPNSLKLLQRRLKGLPYHIKNAAEYLLNHSAPIEVDLHNGSWQSKQASKSVIQRHVESKCQSWYQTRASMGLPVPVYHCELGLESVELDSIDRIDAELRRVHLNKHGWFEFKGTCVSPHLAAHQTKSLLLPNKPNMVAACCGHSWNHKGKTIPRTLELRELLLSTKINWKTFT